MTLRNKIQDIGPLLDRLTVELNSNSVDKNHDLGKGPIDKFDRTMKLNKFVELKWNKPIRKQEVLYERQDYEKVNQISEMY